MKKGGWARKQACLNEIIAADEAGQVIDEHWIMERFGVSELTAKRYYMQVGNLLKSNGGEAMRLTQSHTSVEEAPVKPKLPGKVTVDSVDLSGGFCILQIGFKGPAGNYVSCHNVKYSWKDGRLDTDEAKRIIRESAKGARNFYGKDCILEESDVYRALRASELITIEAKV